MRHRDQMCVCERERERENGWDFSEGKERVVKDGLSESNLVPDLRFEMVLGWIFGGDQIKSNQLRQSWATFKNWNAPKFFGFCFAVPPDLISNCILFLSWS